MRRLKRIPNSSVFAPLRALPRLGSFPNLSEDWFGCEDEPNPFTLMPPLAAAPDHPLRPYLGFRQNDAAILNISEYSDGGLSITFDDMEVGTLFYLCTDAPRKENFPVEIEFRGIADLHLLRLVEQGVYQLTRHRRNIPW